MLAMAARGEAREGDWLVADRQTAGRGRQGRAWASPPGNLYASGLVELRPGNPLAPTLALVTAVAIADALALPGLTIKWPNDLLASGRKLTGILLDRQCDAVVIGVGINIAHHPDLPDRPTASLAMLGYATTPDVVLNAVAEAFARWLDIWRADFAAVRRAWLDRAHPAGTPLNAALPDGSRIAGTFDGLTEDGALRLRLPDGGVRVIHAGDVFLV